jgi:hypothetical protein
MELCAVREDVFPKRGYKTGFTSEEVEHLPSYDGPIVHGVRFGENADLGGSVNSFIGLGAVYPVVG